jgi:hypothetical protein
MNDLLRAALHYAELGYAVFPCVPGRKEPLTKNGFLDATNRTTLRVRASLFDNLVTYMEPSGWRPGGSGHNLWWRVNG